MTEGQIVWRGLTLGGFDSGFGVQRIVGWLGLPGGKYDSQASIRGHGLDVTPVIQDERLVIASGVIRGSRETRDVLVQRLLDAAVPAPSDDDSTEPLVITFAGRTGTAGAQLLMMGPDTDMRVWAAGTIPWSAQWRCPDPRVFGATLSATVPLVVNTSGLGLPHSLPMSLPAKPIGGTITVTNPGNNREGSPVIVTLTGAQSGTVGVANVTTGRQVTFDLGLSATDVLVIDTERGGAFLNGEYRPASGFSDVVASLRAAPGVNVFRALGSAGAGSPSISVAVRPASW